MQQIGRTRNDDRCGGLWRLGGLRALRRSLVLLWSVTDGYVKRRLAVICLLVTLAALIAALTPISLKFALDRLAGLEPAGAPSHPLPYALGSPLVLIFLYVLGQYITRIVSELRFVAHGQVQGRVARNISLRLFDHLVRLPMRFHLDRRTGALGQTGELGITGCEQLLHNLMFTILPVTVEFIAVVVVLLHFGYPVYMGILAMAAITYVVVFERGAAGAREPALAMANARIDAHAALTDNLLNAETIKYYAAERIVCQRYDARLASVEAAWRSFSRQRGTNGVWVATVFAASLGGSLLYATHEVQSGTMTVGDLVLVSSYITRFVVPLEMFGGALREVVRAVASLTNLLDIFGERIEADGPNVPTGGGELRGTLAFDNVSFRYRQERPMLRNISFSVPAGGTVAIVGVSGSGKSSLIRLLFRLYEPDGGRILLDGTPITALPLAVLRQSIAVVSQDVVLFHDTIGSNIGFGRYGATRLEIEEAARLAHLHAAIMSMPDGYETIVGERGLKLSGGERQRVSIARAALKRPRILVFDEATSSLDSRTESDILRNLSEVSTDCTKLVIAHRLSTIVQADEILVLDAGLILERGTHDELRELRGHYAALWDAQQSGAGRQANSTAA